MFQTTNQKWYFHCWSKIHLQLHNRHSPEAAMMKCCACSERFAMHWSRLLEPVI